MKLDLKYLAIIGTATLFVGQASAQEVLNLVSPSNPRSHINQIVFPPWVKAINEDAGGTIKVVLNTGGKLANPRNIWERVQADVVQIGWGIASGRAKQFPRSTVTGLPLGVSSAEAASVAIWRLHEKGITSSDFEKAGIVPLTIVAFPQSSIHTSKPIKKLADIKGMKMAASSRVAAQMMAILGATPLSFPLPAMYQQVQKGVVDGIYMQWTAFQPFKLHEVTSYHLDGPFGGATGMIWMTKKKFDGLPDAARKALVKNSAEGHSRSFGQHWDRVDASGRKRTAGRGGHTINRVGPEEQAKFLGQMKPVIAGWAKRLPDGQKILDAYKAEVAAASK